MSPSPPPPFQSVTPAQVQALKTELAANGLNVADGDYLPDGQRIFIDGRGIAAYAVYDPAAQTLSVTVTDKPFWISGAEIQDAIQQALAKQPQKENQPQ